MSNDKPAAPPRKPKKGNSSHTKRLARRYMAESGYPYSRAKSLVERAAAAGLLPRPIDHDKMVPALEVLHRLDKAEQEK